MGQRFRELLHRIRLFDFVSYWYFRIRRRLRAASGFDRRAIRNYLAKDGLKKLQLGTGGHRLDGWLNTDLLANQGDVQFDVTEPFDLADGTFDYVFSEHLIEHILYPQGVWMMKESFRVLKPGGVIRIATPNLAAFVDLYRSEKSKLQLDYIEYQTDQSIGHATSYQDTFVINTAVREWGHQFIYDEKILRDALKRVGFEAIQRVELNESSDPELRGLENDARMPEGMLALETIVMEGTKPDR